MNEYDAAEIAYKNGYKQAIIDVFCEMETHLCINKFGEVVIFKDSIEDIKTKYSGD